MLIQAWAVLVLVGSGAAYLALIRKDAAPFTSLATVGAFTVAGFGAFNLEKPVGVSSSDNVVAHTSTETAIAILMFMTALVGVIAFLAAVTGQLTDETTDSPGGTALRDELTRQ